MAQIEEDFCVICYEPGDFVKSQPCECKGTLQFHPKCLDELKEHTHMCPTCKTEFKLPDGPAVLKLNSYETMHVTIEDGKWHGQAHVFDQVGTRQFTESYEHGKSTGRINHYHSNGIISDAQTVYNYRKVGPYIKYYKDGSVKEMGYYNEDRILLYSYKYANDGTIMMSYRAFKEGEQSEYWLHHSIRFENLIYGIRREMKHIKHEIRREMNHIKYDVFGSIKNYFGFA